MALFKVNRGDSTNLPTAKTDGWAYFTTDTGEFFIDYKDDNGNLQRKRISNTYYGECETDASTTAKVVNIPSFTSTSLIKGVKVTIKFKYANSVANPTLNVSETGAKSIMRYGTTAVSSGTTTTGWVAGSINTFTYDGTNWVREYWNNTTYSNVALGHGYATCSTAAATVAKTASLSSYALTTGGIVAVKFTYNVPASATLNINSKGAKAIYHKGAAIKAGVIKAGDTATFIYNGTYYHLLSVDRDDNTTYSAATTSAAGLMSAADKTKLDGVEAGATNVTVYTASQCTSYTSDSGTCTPLAVQNGAKKFAITRPSSSTNKAITRYSNTTGDVQDSKIVIEDVTNTKDSSKKAQVISIPAEGGKKMVYGYCTDQVDGTSFIGGVFDASATSYPYAQGLAIGGTSGNLLWKGTKVATTSDIPTKTSQLTNDSGFLTSVPSHNQSASTITSGTLAVARGGTGVTSNPSMLVNLGSTSAASVFAASPRPGVTGTLPIANGGTGATTAAAALTALGAAAADHNHANDGINPMYIELFPGENATNGGYIDFHYANSTDDYTTRIIESQSGQLRVEGTMQVADTSNTASGARVRNIYVTTTDQVAGQTSMATGRIILVYE